ncbi:hypothetical protein E3N88_33877 [Mikania micrantha]|uniref:t-SNARE coiled-coil homology domain-containing protein n=1 Tax=Mikania micrantha TaxID=192012 RepID=A0A5N6MD68_9ASTR|nr:hypothetical protein E3N88_33877 [Mikania micrantha]
MLIRFSPADLAFFFIGDILALFVINLCISYVDLGVSLMTDLGDVRGGRSALFDDIEDGGIRATSSYSSHEIDEQENDRSMDGLQDRVLMLKRLTGDIHEEVEGHNRMLDRMGNDMDSSRGMLSGTMDKFKTVRLGKRSSATAMSANEVCIAEAPRLHGIRSHILSHSVMSVLFEPEAYLLGLGPAYSSGYWSMLFCVDVYVKKSC